MFNQSANNQQDPFHFFKSIQQTQVNDNFQQNFPLALNIVANNSTSTSSLQMPSTNPQQWIMPVQEQTPLNMNDSNGLHALSNTTVNNLGNSQMIDLNQAISMLTVRNRSQSVGSIPLSSSLNFSPNNSNSSAPSFSFASMNSGNDSMQMSTSLPNSNFTTKNFQLNQGFDQAYALHSDYKVTTTATQNPDNNQEQLKQMLSDYFAAQQQFGNYQQVQQVQPTNNFVSPSLFVIQSSGPQMTQQQQSNNNSFNNSPTMTNLLINQPTSPNQVMNVDSARARSPTKKYLPSFFSEVEDCQLQNTNPAMTTTVTQSNNTFLSPNTITSPNSNSSNSGKQRKKRSVSNASSSSSFSCLPYNPVSPSTQFSNTQFERNEGSPKRGGGRKSLKFQVDFTDDAQKFEHKHTNFTPTTMKKHIDAKDERERSGLKRRGRPKGSGIKQQVKRGDVLFYKNCYSDVKGLYNGPPPPNNDDDEGGFTV